MPRRTTLDVIADILRIASAPTSRTQILYAANLSHTQVVKYIEMLVACGMLSRVAEKGSSSKYVSTDSGRVFLGQIAGKFGRISPGERSVWG